MRFMLRSFEHNEACHSPIVIAKLVNCASLQCYHVPHHVAGPSPCDVLAVILYFDITTSQPCLHQTGKKCT